MNASDARTTTRLGQGRSALPAVLVGAQITWAATIVPAYRHMSTAEYLRAHTLLSWYADALMPTLGGATALAGFLRYRRTGEVYAVAGSTALAVASMAAQVNLAINARMRRRLSANTWTRAEICHDRDHWARLHLVRLTGGAIALFTTCIDGSPSVDTGRPSDGAKLGWMDVIAVALLAPVVHDIARHIRMMRGRGPSAAMRAIIIESRSSRR
jgi:hypothetical protein